MLFEIRRQRLIDDGADDTRDFRIAELRLRLAFELRIFHLHGNDGREAFADVRSGDGGLVLVFRNALDVVVDATRDGTLETRQMRAAFNRVDVVGVGVDGFVVAVVVLHGDFRFQIRFDGLEVDDVVQGVFIGVQMGDELLQTAEIVIDFFTRHIRPHVA